MAFEFGFFNEYSDSVTFANPTIHAAAKVIDLGPYVGAFYQKMGSPNVTYDTKEFEIYSRTQTSRDGAIGTTAWSATATTGLSMAASVVNGLTVGHILNIDGEVVIIKSVDRSSNTIDVLKRAVSGTAKAHSAGTLFKVIGFAGADQDLANVEAMSETTTVWNNYMQTVFEVINWRKHGELTRKGMTDANAIAFLITEAEQRIATMLGRMMKAQP